jgi:hypothetical protein
MRLICTSVKPAFVNQSTYSCNRLRVEVHSCQTNMFCEKSRYRQGYKDKLVESLKIGVSPLISILIHQLGEDLPAK